MYLCVLHVRQESLTCKRLRDHHKCTANDIIMLWLRLHQHHIDLSLSHITHDMTVCAFTPRSTIYMFLLSVLCFALFSCSVLSFPLASRCIFLTLSPKPDLIPDILHLFHLHTPKLKKSCCFLYSLTALSPYNYSSVFYRLVIFFYFF